MIDRNMINVLHFSLEVDRFPSIGAAFVSQQCVRVLFCTTLAVKDVVPVSLLV